MVPGFGNRKAKILVLGEAPARQEVIEGKPFVGKAGKEARDLFGSVGLDFDTDVYRTNASLEPVQGDKDDWFFEPSGRPTQVLLQGLAALMQDINEIRPNVVVPMGNYALWAMMQHTGIMKWRGSILHSQVFNVKVIPTLHPAALLWDSADEEGSGMYKYRPVIIWDLERVREQTAFPDIRLRPRRYLVDPVGTDRAMALERLHAAKRLTFDCEGPKGKIGLKCISFSDFDPEWAVCFWHRGTETLELFRSLLETDTPKVGQNLMYDCGDLDQLGIHVRNVEHDTMLAQHVIMPDLPKGLDFLGSIYTDIPYWKEEGKTHSDKEDPVKLMTYCCKDNCATTESAVHQKEHFAEEEDLKATFHRSMAIFPVLQDRLLEGVKVDIPLMDQLAAETNEKRIKLQATLNKAVGYDLNVNSTPAVKHLVYVERGLPPRYRKKKLTTQANVMMDLAAKTNDPVLINILRVRQARKLLSSYYKRALLSPDGRLRWEYKIAGTKTGRMSAQEPTWGPGLNGQTLPAKARRMIVPDDGWEFCEADGMQAESVVTAVYANDPVHLDCFRTGKDVHRVTAALLLGMDPAKWADIPKYSKVRQLGKTCNHAFDYDMGDVTFMYTVNEDWDPEDPESLRIDLGMATSLRSQYLIIRPALEGYWEWVRKQLRDTRTLRNVFGRTRIFLDKLTDTVFKDAYSYLPQGTVGDYTNIGILQVLYASRKAGLDIRFVAQTHDSGLWTYPIAQRDAAVPLILANSEVPLHINGILFTIPIEAAIGGSWYKLQPNDPPEYRGLRGVGASRRTIDLGAQEYQDMSDRMVETLREAV